MSGINEKELVRRISQTLEQSEEESQEMLDIVFTEIYRSLKRGDSVTIRNVGKFYVKPTRDTWIFKFSPSQKWKKMLGWASGYKGDL